nr:A-kinase anchoring protein 7 isoform X2 [Anolis sagrei ordinatus]
MALRLLLRTLRASCLAAPPIGRQIPLCSPAPLAAGRGTASCRAFRERCLLLAEPQRPAMEGEAGEEEPPVLPATSGQTDGKQIVQRKKKQRRKQRKKSDCLDDSFDCLIMEMPFAEVDIEEEFSTTSTIKTKNKKKRKRTTGRENDEDDLIKKKKKDQDRPNYFISVPITNPKISDGIHALQDTIIEKDGRLSKAMIHYGSFHVTLLVMHLSTEAAIDNAVSAFLKSQGLIEELLQGKPLDLSFQGTDHFRNQVGFVKLMESDNTTTLLKITEIVKNLFQEKGIIIGDDKAFKPHLTFMKLSKSPKLRKQGVKKIDPHLFENFKNHHFGDEPMTRLDLCSMLKKKQSNGYYYCESSIIVEPGRWFLRRLADIKTDTGKSHEADVIKEALHRELSTLLSKLNKIKVILASPEIRAKMFKELLGKGLVNGSN